MVCVRIGFIPFFLEVWHENDNCVGVTKKSKTCITLYQHIPFNAEFNAEIDFLVNIFTLLTHFSEKRFFMNYA